ncbi:MAG: PepSY domain-containing protein, partial [Methyloligellaceae bacterium]
MRFLLALALAAISSPALAGPHCTDEPQSKWLTKAEMMERIKPMGHRIEVFKTTKGN